MNTEQKVCPLAVIGRAAGLLDMTAPSREPEAAAELLAVGAAVAELVEAQRKLLAFATACDDAMTACGRGISPDCEHGDVLRFSRAALAAFSEVRS